MLAEMVGRRLTLWRYHNCKHEAHAYVGPSAVFAWKALILASREEAFAEVVALSDEGWAQLSGGVVPLFEVRTEVREDEGAVEEVASRVDAVAAAGCMEE